MNSVSIVKVTTMFIFLTSGKWKVRRYLMFLRFDMCNFYVRSSSWQASVVDPGFTKGGA